MKKIQSLSGMLDLFKNSDKHQSAEKIFKVEELLKLSFSSFNFSEIRTPALEETDLFKRSAGDVSDIVNKEIYSFFDRNDKSISLRPEGTAGVIRSMIEKKQDTLTNKFWYIGPMWRYERPQKGRFRQFNQAGVEILGYEEGSSEFELISLICNIIKDLDVKDAKIKINHLGDPDTKKKYCEDLVSYLTPYLEELSETERERLQKNPLKVLDSKNERTQEILKNGPVLKKYLPLENIQLLNNIKETFSEFNNIEIDYSLVRGLDYYSGFVFEASSSNLGAQDSFLGGGRYDILSEKLGGKNLPAIGLAIGIERLADIANIDLNKTKTVSFITITSNLEPKAFKIAHQLRTLNKSVTLDVNLSSGSLKSKLRRANKIGASHAIIIGDGELESGSILIKYLDDELRSQETVSHEEVLSFYKSL
ncbi:MAG: histidine--tRNA ligase [SAR86 cluster bacterium]|nr:histidine--tRNA ligase [SAR86 cluster bacterium]|tara:strand:- start:7251 stop:8513 length:1263 start_codon:yes stop_codon:yes gene_type:complete